MARVPGWILKSTRKGDSLSVTGKLSTPIENASASISTTIRWSMREAGYLWFEEEVYPTPITGIRLLPLVPFTATGTLL